MALHPSTVARALARSGYRTHSDPNREGVRVRRGQGVVYVVVDHDTPGSAARLSVELEAVLRDLGYIVERVTPTLLRVSTTIEAPWVA